MTFICCIVSVAFVWFPCSLPQQIMSNSDLGRLLKSDEIQNAIRQPKRQRGRRILKKNPLKNTAIMLRLNPYADVTRRTAILEGRMGAYKRQAKIAERRGVSNILLCSVFTM